MPERLRLLSLDCPNCGSKLPPKFGAKSLHCGGCGRDILIDWGGSVSAANCLALAKADFGLQDFAGAETQIIKALETNSDLEEVWFWRGLICFQKDPGSASYLERNLQEFLRHAQLTNEEAVESLMSAGKIAVDIFYPTSFYAANSVLKQLTTALYVKQDGQEGAGVSETPVAAGKYAAYLLEAARRLDPDLAKRKSENICRATKSYISAEANRRLRGLSGRGEHEEFERAEGNMFEQLGFMNIPLALGVAYTLDPKTHLEVAVLAGNYSVHRMNEWLSVTRDSGDRAGVEELARIEKERFYGAAKILMYPPQLIRQSPMESYASTP